VQRRHAELFTFGSLHFCKYSFPFCSKIQSPCFNSNVKGWLIKRAKGKSQANPKCKLKSIYFLKYAAKKDSGSGSHP